MPLKQHIQQALANIFSAKLRSFLAVLGILVGTASVVALVSSGQLATKKALDQFKHLGTDLMAMSFYLTGSSKSNSAPDEFTLEEIVAMPGYVPQIKLVAPYTTVYVPINYDGKRVNGSIVGVTEALQETIKIELIKGRFVSFLDEYNYYCVLGNKLYKQIQAISKEPVIGKQIRLGKLYFTIAGVAKHWPENSFFNADINNAVLVPIHTSTVLSKYSKIRNLVMKLEEKTDIPQIQNEINSYVAQNSIGLRTFFRSASQLINSMEQQNQIFTLLLGMIGSISLFVGGIGVMNVMLVSVAERRREIGIRMAVGAKRKDIRTLFLVESIILAFFGGTMGIVAGIIASYVIAVMSNWDFTIFLLPPLLGFLVSVATGIFFGFYPAHRASKLDPIQTLRYD